MALGATGTLNTMPQLRLGLGFLEALKPEVQPTLSSVESKASQGGPSQAPQPGTTGKPNPSTTAAAVLSPAETGEISRTEGSSFLQRLRVLVRSAHLTQDSGICTAP